MPIVVNLDIMLARRKTNLTELSEKVNITVPNLSILKSGRARAIRFTTLNSICEALECKPGDVLDWVDDETYRKLFKEDWPGYLLT